MQIHFEVLGKRLCQRQGVQLDIRTPMSESLENRGDDVPSTKNRHVSRTKRGGYSDSLPNLSLF